MMMKSSHSGISLAILFFLILILVAQPQRFSGTRSRKEEPLSHSLDDARKAKRKICVSLRDRRQFNLFIVLREATRHRINTRLYVSGQMQRLEVFSQPCRYVPRSHISALLAPCLVNTSVWSLRWVKWCNCSLMLFPNVCSDTSTRRKTTRSSAGEGPCDPVNLTLK